MKLTFLGTSAANAFPEPFCSCLNCKSARAEGGKSLRKRSSALINNDLLVDLGPDIMSAAQQHSISLTNVQYCIQTHPHADHMDLSHLLSRSPGFGVTGAPRLDFFASRQTLEKAKETFLQSLSHLDLLAPEAHEELNLQVHPLEPYRPTSIGRYTIIGFPANHAPGTGAFIYAIVIEGCSILYATDTATLWEDTWRAFHRLDMRFDLVVLDHTYGPNEAGTDHLSAHQVADHVQRMRDEALLSSTGVALATHIAHEGNPAHSQLSEFAGANGYQIAHDGLAVSINK